MATRDSTRSVTGTTPRVALYARVSTKNSQDPETQLLALREYAHARGFEIFSEYVDVGISGSKDSRPALNRLMADARKRRFDAVLVARFDRFARSTRHLVLALEEFNALGVDFISLSESVDTSTPMGKMVYTVIAAVAELERSLIRERVVMGLQRAKAQGKRLGRPATEIDPAEVHMLREQGMSFRAIARQLGVSSPYCDGIRSESYWNLFLNATPARSAAATPTDSKTKTLAFISSPFSYGRPYR